MKKRNRLVSLLLVLAMVLAMAPAVLAAGDLTEGTVTASDVSMTVAETGKKIVPSCTGADAEGEADKHTFTYAVQSGADCVTVAADGTLTALKAGQAVVRVTCACGATCDVNVTVGKKTLTPTISSTLALTAKTGTAQADVVTALNAKFSQSIADFADKDKLHLTDWTLVGDYTSAEKATVSFTATVQLVEAFADDYAFDSVGITATVTFANEPKVNFNAYNAGGVSGTKVLNCAQNEKNADKRELEIELSWVPEDASATYQWFKGTTATYSESTFTPLSTEPVPIHYTGNVSVGVAVDADKAGTAYYVCKITATKDGLSTTSVSDVFTVNVRAPYRIVLTAASTNSTTPRVGNRLIYTATVQKYAPGTVGTNSEGYVSAVYGTDYDNITYTATPVNGTLAGSYSTSGYGSYYNTYNVDLKGVGSTYSYASFTLKAEASLKGATLAAQGATTTTQAVTYQPAVTQNVIIQPTGSYAVMDMSKLSSAVLAATGTSVTTGITPTRFSFATAYGTFNGTTATTAQAYANTTSGVYFTPSSLYAGFTNQNVSVTFTAYDAANYTVATGTIKFNSAASISYSTRANTAVSFVAADFQSFFKKAMNNSAYATLSYVSFGTPSVTTGSAAIGTLSYSNSYLYTSTQITAANLGSVAYTPSNSLNFYTVTVPFTAYGYSTSYTFGTPTAVSGSVEIKVNDGHIISMTGVKFKTAAIANEIYTKYPGMGYVRFAQPQAKTGKLYYNYSSIASKGTLVSSTENYYYSATGSQKAVDNIYFVPAADCATAVTISYTVYSSANIALGTGTITFSVTKKAASEMFYDVTASNTGSWSADAVDFLASNSIINGKEYNTFAPKDNMTRGDFVLMLYRLAGKPSVSGVSNPFTDVKSSDYYYSAILWAYRNNVVTGVDAKTFAPKKNITREQIAATLYRLAGTPSSSGSVTGYYDSNKIHNYALSAMKWAVANGVLAGSSGYLNPVSNANRAEVATMLHRYVTK